MPEASSRQRLFLIWAITATIAAVILANVALVLFIRGRASARQTASNVTSLNLNSPFLTLQEADVIGRYKYFESGNEVGTIELLSTHSIINKDGTTYPQYRWEILRDGLLTVWQKNSVAFTVIEKPGVYVSLRNDGTEYRRIEKLE